MRKLRNVGNQSEEVADLEKVLRSILDDSIDMEIEHTKYLGVTRVTFSKGGEQLLILEGTPRFMIENKEGEIK